MSLQGRDANCSEKHYQCRQCDSDRRAKTVRHELFLCKERARVAIASGQHGCCRLEFAVGWLGSQGAGHELLPRNRSRADTVHRVMRTHALEVVVATPDARCWPLPQHPAHFTFRIEHVMAEFLPLKPYRSILQCNTDCFLVKSRCHPGSRGGHVESACWDEETGTASDCNE